MSSPADVVTIVKGLLPSLVPALLALGGTSLVILVSNSFTGLTKIMFQSSVLGVSLAASISYLLSHNSVDLKVFWAAFSSLSHETRLSLAVIAISVTYFGGAMYVAAPERSEESGAVAINATPASIDVAVGFDVPAVLPESDKVFFEEYLNKLTHEILSDVGTTYEMGDEAVAWIRRMVDYTVAGGKMNRGLALMDVQKTLAADNGRVLSNKERCQSAALGWCVEFLQAFFLVADDVMDDSVTRRGQPCWFRLPEVKLISINDSFLLESFVYKILKKYFGDETYYHQLVDLFLETTRQTEFGQLMDLTSQPQGGVINLDRFTMTRYTSIVKYKTAFYSFYLPIALAMIAHGITDRALFLKARQILLEMGEYFQIQDDYLDCYGAPEVIGKIGTDIEDNKCSWLVVKALAKVTAKQRKVLEENYGQHDAKKVAKVKKLYAELELEAEFHAYEEESYKSIRKLMSEVTTMPIAVFEFMLMKIYKRSK